MRGAPPGRFPFLATVGFASALVGAVSALPPSKPLEQDGWILALLWVAAFFAGESLVDLVGRTAMAAGTGVLVGAAGLGALLNPPDQEQLHRLLVLELLGILGTVPVLRSRLRAGPPRWPAHARSDGESTDVPLAVSWTPQPEPTRRLTGTTRLSLNDRWLLDARPLEGADPGGFGVPYHAIDLWTPGREAIVKLQSSNPGLEAQSRIRLEREHEMLVRLDSPHVIRLYDGGEDRHTGRYYLALEYHPAGSLAQWMSKLFVTDLARICDIAAGLLGAIEYLHHRAPRPLVHRDVSPRNALLDRTHKRVVMIDFGSARYLDTGDGNTLAAVTTGPLFSSYYSPPEMATVVMQGQWGPPTDVYGVGAIVYELVTGLAPYHREERRSGVPFQELVSDSSQRIMPAGQINHDLPPILDRLLEASLLRNPRSRPSVEQFFDVVLFIRRRHGDLRIGFWDLRHRL